MEIDKFRNKMKKYIIRKNSRWTSIPIPYNGPTCERARIEGNKFYFDLNEAKKDAEILSQLNPIGFSVIDYDTNESTSD